MTRRKVSPQFRARFSEKLMDLGNLAAAALVFGQFISGKEFAREPFILGVIMIISCYTISYLISQ